MTYPIEPPSLCAFYSVWVAISFSKVLGSARVNYLFMGQCLCTFSFFFIRNVVEGVGSLITKKKYCWYIRSY